MSRGLGVNVTNALASNGFRLATLLEINIGASTFYLTDYGVDLTDVDAQVYGNSADFIELSSVSETGALKVNSLSLTLSGADQIFIAALLNGDYIEKDVLVRRAVVNASDLVVESFLFFDGRITTYQIEDTERESRVVLEVASHWSDFEKVNNRRTNLNSQQVYFPNDMGFQYASKIVKDLRWGRSS